MFHEKYYLTFYICDPGPQKQS